MKDRLYLAIVLVIAGMLFPVSSPLPAADTYTVDGVHSSVLFHATRMNVVEVYGRFDAVSGSLTVDPDQPAKSSIEIEIQVESVNTSNERRDAHLKSPDFFNAKQFPVMAFKSTGVKKVGEGEFEVTGDFKLHGVTKPVTATVRQTGAGKDPRQGASLIGFESTFTIKRSDFGMKFMTGMISDEVGVILAIHGVSE